MASDKQQWKNERRQSCKHKPRAGLVSIIGTTGGCVNYSWAYTGWREKKHAIGRVSWMCVIANICNVVKIVKGIQFISQGTIECVFECVFLV